MTVVGLGDPFQSITEKVLNPLPLTVSVQTLPTFTLAGETESIAGAGLVTGTIVASARSILMRGTVTLPRNLVSRTGNPVCRKASRMVDTLAVGTACRNAAHAPRREGRPWMFH